MTDKRMADNGICMDLVCLSKHPLHAVPLVQFVNDHTAIQSISDKIVVSDQLKSQRSNIRSVDKQSFFFENEPFPIKDEAFLFKIPSWIDCIHWSVPSSTNRFVPRCSTFLYLY
jgi:hypothetical protein